MSMEEIRLSYTELIYWLIAINIVLGVLFGFLPLIAGLLRKKRWLAISGFFASIIGGAILGVFLSFPLSALFIWLISRDSKAAGPAPDGIQNQ